LKDMPRRILLVRHCQSQANADGRLEGKGDSPLSTIGLEQAKRVAAFIAAQDIGPAVLLVSPQSRARSTAQEIATLCGWTPSHDHRIREGEFGWMEDMSYAELGEHMAKHQLRTLDVRMHGGESREAIAERFWEALSEAMNATHGPLIAVTHGYAIHSLVEHQFGHELALGQIGNGDVIELWMEGSAVTGPPKRHSPA
jgi:broad specificity phosphatase PhoE